jgi:transcriptional regulator with XRE-family HTH domain
MKQVELAKELGVSKAYISMVMQGKKKPSKQIATRLKRMGIEVNSLVNFKAKNQILSHARLPIPTLPRRETAQYNSILRSLPQTMILSNNHRVSGLSRLLRLLQTGQYVARESQKAQGIAGHKRDALFFNRTQKCTPTTNCVVE